MGVAAGSQGRLYVTDSRARVVEMVPDGGRRVLAGAHPGFANGMGTAASMREPCGIAVASDGRVVVADTLNGLIRVLDMPERLGPWTPTPPALATGFDLARFARVPLVWPVEPQEGPHEVAGTLGEPRGNAGGDGRERFHAGVDVRADQGEPVRAVRDGVVSSVLAAGSVGTLNEFLIGRTAHLRPHPRWAATSAEAPVAAWATVLADPVTGKPARVRVRRGTHVAAGDVIGSVNRFRHVHLNVGTAGRGSQRAAGRFARRGRHRAAGDCAGRHHAHGSRRDVRSPNGSGAAWSSAVRCAIMVEALRPDGRQSAAPAPRRLPLGYQVLRRMARRRWRSCSRTSRSRSTGCRRRPTPRLRCTRRAAASRSTGRA